MSLAVADDVRLTNNLQAVGQKQGLWIARAIGLEPVNGVHESHGQHSQRHLRVDGETMPPGVRADLLCDDMAESFAEAGYDFGIDAKPGCRRVPAMADEIDRALLERFVQLESG